MRKNYETLRNDYKVLEEEYKKSKEVDKEQNRSSLSVVALKEYVQNEILNTEANSSYIPDAIESKLYVSVYKTILEALCQLSNSTEITMLNHKISFHIEPK